jgi:hypothetical protein
MSDSYQSFCHGCDEHWTNTSPNCPNCGSPDPQAQRIQVKANGKKRRKAKKENTMNEETDSVTATFTKAAADAMKQGGMLALAQESNELIKSGVAKGLIAAGMSPEALESAIFQKGLPVMSSAFLLFLAERFPDQIPQSEHVAKAASLALSSATAESIRPVIAAAAPTLMALASRGQQIAELEGDVYDEEEEEEEEAAEGFDPEAEYNDAEFSEREIEVTPHEPNSRPSGPPRGVPVDRAARPKN